MNNLFASFKDSRIVKGIIYSIVGVFSYPGINMVNKLQIKGMENLENLPNRNVLFVSNHQTYFADVITFIHIFCASRWRKKNKLGIPFYLLWPFTRIKYVAAEETMKRYIPWEPPSRYRKASRRLCAMRRRTIHIWRMQETMSTIILCWNK